MKSELPSVSIIIPTRPGQSDVLAVSAARSLDYPSERLEILLVRGRQPACQRNAALREAQGDLVYFLDDDSRPLAGNLHRAVEHFRREDVWMVGGPNVCPPEAPLLEKIFSVVLSSWLAFGPSRARYERVGGVRETGEKELILCNLLARREPLLEVGGFDEALYPNEENALMDGLRERGGRLLYDPELVVYRRPRPTVRAFARMLMTYGRGRAEQFRRHPTLGSALNFVPPLFVLYLVAGLWWGAWARWPLAAYGVVVGVQTLASSRRHGLGKSLAAAPGLVLTHVLYGAGFWRGLFTRFRAPADRQAAAQIDLERIKALACGN